jgi:hypothetical protein
MKLVKAVQNYECQFADDKTISGNLEDSQFESKLMENDSQCEKASSTTKLLFERTFDEKNEIKNLEAYESFNQKYNIIEITYDWTSKKSSFRIIINSEPTIQDKDYYERIITTHIELFNYKLPEVSEIGYEEDGKYNIICKNDNVIDKENFKTIDFEKIKDNFKSISKYVKTSEFENYVKDNQNKLEELVDKYFDKKDDEAEIFTNVNQNDHNSENVSKNNYIDDSNFDDYYDVEA